MTTEVSSVSVLDTREQGQLAELLESARARLLASPARWLLAACMVARNHLAARDPDAARLTLDYAVGLAWQDVALGDAPDSGR